MAAAVAQRRSRARAALGDIPHTSAPKSAAGTAPAKTEPVGDSELAGPSGALGQLGGAGRNRRQAQHRGGRGRDSGLGRVDKQPATVESGHEPIAAVAEGARDCPLGRGLSASAGIVDEVREDQPGHSRKDSEDREVNQGAQLGEHEGAANDDAAGTRVRGRSEGDAVTTRGQL